MCPLGHQRDNIVLARAGVVGGSTTGGMLPCDVLFVGEAPGASEDASGLPFWGLAGDLLQQMIDRSLPTGTTYAMSNLVACFPREAKERGDNEPEHSEILACKPRLQEFIDLCRPKLIVTVGTLASAYVHCHYTSTVSIDHPAYILRMPMAQKQMAAQRAIVTIRNAAMDMLQSEDQLRTRNQHADEQTTKDPLPTYGADDIPF